MDDAQQLVGGGEDGPFVADAAGLRPVVLVELRVLRARGAVGALGERGPQRRVALAGAPGAALAGAGVVPRGDAGPSAEMARLAEGSQVGSDLGEDGAGAANIDTGNRLQQTQRA